MVTSYHSSQTRFIGKKMMEPCFSMSEMQAKSFWSGHYNTLSYRPVMSPLKADLFIVYTLGLEPLLLL